MFINSEPPRFRKAKKLAVEVSSFEAHFLSHTSYIDTTNLVELESTIVQDAVGNQDRHLGSLHPNVRDRIITEITNHDVLPDVQKKTILE